MSQTLDTTTQELPCIWMLAGVLSYRLCDRNYDCERCELFHALRGGGQGRCLEAGLTGTKREAASSDETALDVAVSSYLSRLTAGCELHLDRPYCPCHFWLRAEPNDRVRLGLDGHLSRLLYPIDDITLPHVGVRLRRAEPCGWITRGSLALPLKAPISGEVEAVNDALLEKVRAEGRLNGGEDWLMRLKAHEDLSLAPGLYRGEKTLIWYLRKLQVLKCYLRESLAAGAAAVAGATLTDGGAPNMNVEQVLGRERFEALVEELFHLQI